MFSFGKKKSSTSAADSSPESSAWESRWDANSQRYYYLNTVSNESVWDRPHGYVPRAEDFEERLDSSSGRTYWYDKTTEQSQWERPTSWGREPVASDFTECTDPTTGKVYYMNNITQEASWERPACWPLPEPPTPPPPSSSLRKGKVAGKTTRRASVSTRRASIKEAEQKARESQRKGAMTSTASSVTNRLYGGSSTGTASRTKSATRSPMSSQGATSPKRTVTSSSTSRKPTTTARARAINEPTTQPPTAKPKARPKKKKAWAHDRHQVQLLPDLKAQRLVTWEIACKLAKHVVTEEVWESISPKFELPDDPLEEGVSPDLFREVVAKNLDLLCVYDVSCEGLENTDGFGSGISDPYVIFVVGEAGTSFDEKVKRAALDFKGAMSQTPVAKNTLSPSWLHRWSGELRCDKSIGALELHLRVLDSDGQGNGMFFRDDLLGEATVDVSVGVKGEDCSIPLSGGEGVAKFKFQRTNDVLKETLSSDEKARSKIVGKGDIDSLNRGAGFGTPECKALKTAFDMGDAVRMCQLSNLVYFAKANWASKQEGQGQTYEPERMSVPLRYWIGDLTRTGVLKDSPFDTETLDPEFDLQMGKAKFTNGVFNDAKSDEQAMVLVDKNTRSVIVSFRGTEKGNFSDVGKSFAGLHPFKAKDPTCKDGKGKVHSEMAKSWNRLSKSVLPVIRSIFEFNYDEDNKYEKLYICGHSLGGALATVFAKGVWEAVPALRKKIVGYTYGAYAIGDAAFQRDFNEKIPNFFRCVNDKDFVPHLMPSYFGFEHTGMLIHLTDSRCYVNHDNFTLKSDDWGAGDGIAERFTDHKCLSYASLLRMFDCLNKMTKAQAAKCERGWLHFTEETSVQMISSLVPDADGAMTVQFERSVATNLAALGVFFREEFEGTAGDGSDGVTLKDFRTVLHQNITSEKSVVAYKDFVCVCYDLLFDKDTRKRLAKVRRARHLSTFRKYDIDFDGFLSPKEFRTMCKNEFAMKEEQDIRHIADAIDLNMDGYLSEQEFVVWALVAMGEH
ncbi:hypothetical protein TrVE_jg1217 [Triparma verrucosa]|uniref:Calmodulin n=1 Tax=Triparma verrucosa TaxID=1606542 RepID=A0A9W7FBP1_9STRA|nr:hypothetical protein TrVE_jg1217 [Triparma verrucosa]